MKVEKKKRKKNSVFSRTILGQGTNNILITLVGYSPPVYGGDLKRKLIAFT